MKKRMIFVYRPGKVRYLKTSKSSKSLKKSQRDLYAVNSKVANYRPLKALYLHFKFLKTQAKISSIRIQRSTREVARSMKGFSEVMKKNREEEVAECAVVELSWSKPVPKTTRGT